MQLSDSKQLIDCVSAQQLLQALNTLQQMNEQTANQFELSFSQSSHSYFNTACNKGQMDFELYMAIKNNKKNQQNNHKKIRNKNSQGDNKMKNMENPFHKKVKKQNIIPNKQRSSIKEKKTQKTNLSLCKQKSSDIKQFRSRSHSPIQTKRKVVKQNSSSSTVAFTSMFKSKKNKQIQPQPQQIKDLTPIKINEQSKKIMIQREKQGKTYIPIYNRTKQLIKQKQQKIAKLQRINLTQIQLQERECTFKPAINQSKKWLKNKQNNCIKNRHRDRVHTMMDQVGQDSIMLKQAHNNIENYFQSRHSIGNIAKTEKIEGSKVQKSTKRTIQKIQPTKGKQKPKNSKFNILLDLIH